MLRSAAYMAYVRTQSCCACSLPGPSDPHHAETGGTAIKGDDYSCIPLCRLCHNYWHDHHGGLPGVIRGTEAIFILRTQLRLMKAYTYRLENRHGSEKEDGPQERLREAEETCEVRRDAAESGAQG